jgi:hypothetical protein
VTLNCLSSLACFTLSAVSPVRSVSPGPCESLAGSGRAVLEPVPWLPVAPVAPLLEAAPAIAEAPTAIAPSTASAITPDRTLLNIDSSFDRSFDRFGVSDGNARQRPLGARKPNVRRS